MKLSFKNADGVLVNKMATPKQMALIEKIAVNTRSGTPKAIGPLMREVGYSKHTANHPDRIIKTNNFIELLERNGVTDKRISNAVRGALLAMNGKKADHSIRLKAADMACRLKGHLKDSDNGGMDSIGALVSSLKEVDVQVLLIMKNKIHAQSEPIDVT